MDLITIVGTMCRNLNELCEIMYRDQAKKKTWIMQLFLSKIYIIFRTQMVYFALFFYTFYFFKRVIQSYVTFNTFRLYLYKYNQF